MFSFRNQPDLRSDGPDPLGSDYSPQDRDLDIKSGESLRQIPVPQGLADRVREASLAQWRQQRRLRVGPSRSRIAIKRMALAACMAIAVLAAFWVTGPGLEPPEAETLDVPVAMDDYRYHPTATLLASLDADGMLVGHELTWYDAHDELLSILEAQHSGDEWGYLELEMR
ncbi:MAG: hypothetical protein MK116_02570 [Phycisphaerales bacterium]|nr:hypothetical protein [Phycisphaerales bacterium]